MVPIYKSPTDNSWVLCVGGRGGVGIKLSLSSLQLGIYGVRNKTIQCRYPNLENDLKQ